VSRPDYFRFPADYWTREPETSNFRQRIADSRHAVGDAIVAIVAIIRAYDRAFSKPPRANTVRLAGVHMGMGGDEWGCAVRHLRGSGRLVEDLDNGTWSLGGDSGTIDTRHVDVRAKEALTATIVGLMKEEGTEP
jgi:hypothetical protein